MKTVLGVLVGVTLATALFATPAEARCWWNGYRTVCNNRWYAPPPAAAWPRYPGWEQHRWCYYHPYRCR